MTALQVLAVWLFIGLPVAVLLGNMIHAGKAKEMEDWDGDSQ